MLIQLVCQFKNNKDRKSACTSVNDDPRAPNAFINMKPFGL